jgi:hypothetical protein
MLCKNKLINRQTIKRQTDKQTNRKSDRHGQIDCCTGGQTERMNDIKNRDLKYNMAY